MGYGINGAYQERAPSPGSEEPRGPWLRDARRSLFQAVRGTNLGIPGDSLSLVDNFKRCDAIQKPMMKIGRLRSVSFVGS